MIFIDMSKKSIPADERKIKFTICVSPKIYSELNKLNNKSKYIEEVLEKHFNYKNDRHL
jgi:hypothetical protein